MTYRAKVDNINKKQSGIYAPCVHTNKGFAALPEELRDTVEVGDEVVVYSNHDMTLGGFSALVVETPRGKLSDI